MLCPSTGRGGVLPSAQVLMLLLYRMRYPRGIKERLRPPPRGTFVPSRELQELLDAFSDKLDVRLDSCYLSRQLLCLLL